MLNYLKAFLFFFIWVIIALTSHYLITHKNFKIINFYGTEPSNIIETKSQPALNNLNVISNNETIFRFSKGFRIVENSEKISSIDSIPFLIDSLSIFLINNYDKQLEIIGKYSSSENSNLGSLRANSLKNQLINKGISQKSIKISKNNEPFVFDKNGTFSNGIELKFIPSNSMLLDSIVNVISNKRLYVTVENDLLIENTELIEYTKLLKQFSKKNPSKTVDITGHTNNKGYFENNLILGKNKANKLKEYFIKNGISKIQINTFTRGEAEPIANKYTKEGKLLNNRIEIRIN